MSAASTSVRERVAAVARVSGERARAAEIALVLGTWLCLVVPQLLQVLLVGRGFVPVTGEPRAVPDAVATATTLGNAALVLGCLALVLLHARALPWRTWPLLAILLAPWFWSVALLVVAGRPPGAPVLLYPAIVTAAWAVRPRLTAVPVLGLVVAGTAALSVALGLLAGDRALYANYAGADLDKSLGSFGILAGLLPSGNNLGLCLAVGFPAVLTVRGRWRIPAVAVTVLAIAWSFSRTAWLAVAVAVLLAVALVLVRRRWVVGLALSGLLAVVALVPWFTRGDGAFANRGGYWRESRDAWLERPLAGHGPDWFDELARGAENLGGHAYHAHNQVVHSLVTGGIVLAALTIVVLAVAIVRAVRHERAGFAWAAQTVAALLVLAFLEVPFGSVDRAAFFPYVLLALCLVVLAPEGDRSRAVVRQGAAGA